MIGETAEAIIASSPDFRETWTRFRESDQFSEGEPYNHLGQLARYMVDSLKSGRVKDFPSVFQEVENRLARATPEERDLIIVGFLEDLQNISLNQDIPMTAWTSWLGSKTSEAWKVLEDMWSGKLSPDDFNRYVRGSAGRH